MSEKEKTLPNCPKCGSSMLEGALTGPVDPVRVVTIHSLLGSDLEALICSVCGYIELRATELENLTRTDISDEELTNL